MNPSPTAYWLGDLEDGCHMHTVGVNKWQPLTSVNLFLTGLPPVDTEVLYQLSLASFQPCWSRIAVTMPGLLEELNENLVNEQVLKLVKAIENQNSAEYKKYGFFLK